MYRIFVDAHVFDGEFQGTLTYIKELYLKVLENHPDIIIYFGANKIENVKKVFGGYSNVKYIEYTSTNSLKRIFVEIPKIIDSINCTHAHFQYIIPFKKNKNCKYIVTIHDILFNDFPKEFSLLYRLQRNVLFYLSAKRSDYLLTVSNYSKQQISEQYRIDMDRIIVTPNAVSEDFFQFKPSKLESKKYIDEKYDVRHYILYISRIEPRKNQTILLKAFIDENLWQKGFTLVLIGSNTLETNLFDMMEHLTEDAKKYIKWIEQVDYNDLKHILNAAELFVYPSKAEGFGIPPLEAGALCTPVLCSNATAMKDFDFFAPYIFDPDNYGEFQKKLLDIVENKNSIDVVSIQEEIKNKYSWAQSANILVNKVICMGRNYPTI
jgi:glycosyltransferase involved in cell wall biosynthesis